MIPRCIQTRESGILGIRQENKSLELELYGGSLTSTKLMFESKIVLTTFFDNPFPMIESKEKWLFRLVLMGVGVGHKPQILLNILITK